MRAVGGVLGTVFPVAKQVLRRAFRERAVDRVVLRHIVRLDAAHMQEAEVRGVDIAFQGLQPVALALDKADRGFTLWHQIGLE